MRTIMNCSQARYLVLAMLLAVFLLCSVGMAEARIIEWRLRDVNFEDGGTATGFLVFDTQRVPEPGATVTAPVDFDVRRTHPDETVDYNPAVATTEVGDGGNPFVRLVPFSPRLNFRAFQIGLATPLPADGGIVPLVTLPCRALPCSPSNDASIFGGGSFVVSGELVSTIVPEPRRVLLLGFGLAVFGIVAGMRGQLRR